MRYPDLSYFDANLLKLSQFETGETAMQYTAVYEPIYKRAGF